jgi:hypothetical protein
LVALKRQVEVTYDGNPAAPMKGPTLFPQVRLDGKPYDDGWIHLLQGGFV